MATAGGLEIHMQLAHRPEAPVAAPARAATPGAAPTPAAAGRGQAPFPVDSVVDVLPPERARRASRPSAVPFIAVAIVALLVAGVATAFVRNSAGPATPLAMVQASASTTADAGTAHVSVTVKGAAGPLANGITVDGGFDFARHRAQLELDPSKFGVTGVGPIEAVEDYSSGIVVYMRFPPQLTAQLGGKPWVKLDLGALLSQAGIDVNLGSLTQGQSDDPTSGLRLLRGADSVVNVGTEQVRGVTTTHYRLVVSLDKAIANAPADQRDALTKLATLYTIHTFPVDVWLDGQGRVRRLQQIVDTSTLRLPPAATAGGASRANPFVGPITTTYEVYDFGTPVDVTIPAPDQVTDLNAVLRQGR